MCCRYYFDDDTIKEVWKIVNEVDDKLNYKAGDVHPADNALIIAGEHKNEKLILQEMKWGFTNNRSKELIINARAETALARPTFSRAVQSNRCLIPAAHFYEWDKDKNKVIFSLEDEERKKRTLYMAGIYLPSHDGNHFTVLTTAANDSMKSVHDRMPLILSENDLRDWIFDDEKVGWYLKQSSPLLNTYQEYKQMSLFDLL